LTSLRAGYKIKVRERLFLREFIATPQTIVFTYYIATSQINYFHTFCGVAIHTVNSLEITLILKPARSDVKINLARAYGNKLVAKKNIKFEIRNNKLDQSRGMSAKMAANGIRTHARTN